MLYDKYRRGFDYGRKKDRKMILCVEDDIGIRDLMIYTLNSSGFEAKGLNCGDELFDEIKEESPQIIMLDIILPDCGQSSVPTGIISKPCAVLAIVWK